MILVTGANGQIGTDLVAALRAKHGEDAVLASDLRAPEGGGGAFEALDVTDRARLEALVAERGVTTIYHLASLLSASGEQKPELSWTVNVDGLRNVLDVARAHGCRVFWPSSIAVFGPRTPREDAPQDTILDPKTMYGVTKVTGEMLCDYYARRYDVDVRSLRLPGIISYTAPPGGGTTDYAVDIFYHALREGSYECFLRADTRLPMMYMPDTIRAIVKLMDAPAEQIRVRTSYNLTAVSFSAEELVEAIQERIPGFTCTYAPDFRQDIADSWPDSVDDSAATRDWDWHPKYGTGQIVDGMLDNLAERLGVGAGE